MTSLPAMLAALGGTGALIALVYQNLLKALVEAWIAKHTTNVEVHDNLLRLSVVVVGAAVGAVTYALTVTTPGLHDFILALLTGGAAGLAAIGSYHLAPLPAQLVSALRVAPVAPAAPTDTVTPPTV